MPKHTRTKRNEDLVLKRASDPVKWGWGQLGNVYGIHRQYAKDIFLRDYKTYLTPAQIRAYEEKLRIAMVKKV